MIRRTSLVAVLVALLLFGGVTSAFAWANGGNEGDGYGTHDWVLEQAIQLAGKSAYWVDAPTALLATDDPDTTLQTSKLLHVFKDEGTARGGPHQVATEYAALVAAYQAGDYKTASRLLGVMSHYYSDIAQPFHAKSDDRASIETLHEKYEYAVSAETRTSASSPDLLVARDRLPVSDVRASSVGAAKYARARYPKLLADFSASGTASRAGSDTRVVTREVLSRSVNDLADIIAAVPQGAGLAQVPATMKQSMYKSTYQLPRKGQFVRTQVRCLDSAGRPMEGVAVTFTWPQATGPLSNVIYTDPDGLAYDWEYISLSRNMVWSPLTTKAALNGSIASTAYKVMQTPVLASGATGVKTTLSNTRPRRGTTVRARVRLATRTGKPAAGIPVTFVWPLKSGTVKTRTVTNSKGYAYSSKNIGRRGVGSRIYVKASVVSGGYPRYSRASFISQ